MDEASALDGLGRTEGTGQNAGGTGGPVADTSSSRMTMEDALLQSHQPPMPSLALMDEEPRAISPAAPSPPVATIRPAMLSVAALVSDPTIPDAGREFEDVGGDFGGVGSSSATPTPSTPRTPTPELFDTPADVPRIGGWIAPRPRRGAMTPPLLVPTALDEMDDLDDKPILGEHAALAADQSRTWIQKQRSLDAQRSPSTKPALSGLSAAPFDKLTMASARTQILGRLERQLSRRNVLSERAEIREAVFALISDEMDDVNLDALDQRPSWIIELYRREHGVHLLVIDSQSRDFDVVELPDFAASAVLANERASIKQMYAAKSVKGKARGSDQIPDAVQQASVPATSPLRTDDKGEMKAESSQASAAAPFIMPESEAISQLTKERDELLVSRNELQGRLSEAETSLEASQRSLSSAKEDADLARSVYDEASQAARRALAESSELDEQLSKAQRQVTDGLEGHRLRYTQGLERWREEERQLRAQLATLKSSAEGFETAGVQRRVNEWRAWKIKEEERQAKEEKDRQDREARWAAMRLRDEEAARSMDNNDGDNELEELAREMAEAGEVNGGPASPREGRGRRKRKRREAQEDLAAELADLAEEGQADVLPADVVTSAADDALDEKTEPQVVAAVRNADGEEVVVMRTSPTPGASSEHAPL